jgi:Retrotransposon gag protein
MASGHGHASGSGGTAATTATTTTANGKLAGLPPTVFDGDRTQSDRFLKEFKQWRLLNRNHDEMRQPYNRVLMALTYIKGPRVEDWQEARLEELTMTTLHPDDETLWTNFEQRFKDTYTDSNKKRAAYDKLMALKMIGGDIDTYIATFDNLLAKAGWTRGEEAADFFQKGLPDGVKREVLRRPTWPITLQEWQEASRDKTNRYKARQSLLGQKNTQPTYQHYTRDIARRNWMTRPPPRRDPNAMDVDAAEIQAIRTTYPSPQVREERRRRGQCMQCGKTGHFMKNCPHGQPSKWNRSPGNQSYPIAQQRPNQGRSWTPQQNHMPPRPNRPPQYTQKRTGPTVRQEYGTTYDVVDDRSPAPTPVIHTPRFRTPTTNPGEAEQVVEGMTPDQQTRWRDLNQQDF